jgi:hypothetical protein
MTIRGTHMQIHLFISGSALARNRIKAELKKMIRSNTTTNHQTPNDFHSITIEPYNEPIASVIMPANNKELFQLTQIKDFWSKSKNILILPDEEPETLKLANSIRPVFITNIDDDFSNVALILKHIKNRFEIDIKKSVNPKK